MFICNSDGASDLFYRRQKLSLVKLVLLTEDLSNINQMTGFVSEKFENIVAKTETDDYQNLLFFYDVLISLISQGR